MLARLSRALDAATEAMGVLGTLLIVALTGLIGADVAGRAALGRPVSGVPEMVALSIVAIVFLQLPQAMCAGRLTRSDALRGWLARRAPRLGRTLDVVLDAAALALLAVLLRASWPLFLSDWERGTFVGAIGDFTAPVWPVKLVIVVGTAMLVLQLAARIARALARAPA